MPLIFLQGELLGSLQELREALQSGLLEREVHNDWSQEKEVLTPAHRSGWMETLFLFVQS